MTRCITCEGLLLESQFEPGNPVCKVCVSKLQKVYKVTYSIPERKSIKDSCVDLIVAIREQSIRDGLLNEWEDFWLNDPQWATIWGLFSYSTDESTSHISTGVTIRSGRSI